MPRTFGRKKPVSELMNSLNRVHQTRKVVMPETKKDPILPACWFARKFNKSHHEIENDQRVWNRIDMFINASLRSSEQTHRASLAAINDGNTSMAP